MEQVKHDTAAENSIKRYASPRTREVFVKSRGVLCGSDPSLTDWSNDGSHSDGGDMMEEE